MPTIERVGFPDDWFVGVYEMYNASYVVLGADGASAAHRARLLDLARERVRVDYESASAERRLALFTAGHRRVRRANVRPNIAFQAMLPHAVPPHDARVLVLHPNGTIQRTTWGALVHHH